MALDSLTAGEREARTAEALADPQVGDELHEMASVWWIVVAVEPGGRVAVVKGIPPCTLPQDGKLEVHPSHDAYRQHFGYPTIPGRYWVMLSRRGVNVDGWFTGWPEPEPEPEPDPLQAEVEALAEVVKEKLFAGPLVLARHVLAAGYGRQVPPEVDRG